MGERECWVNCYPSAAGIWRVGALLDNVADANFALRAVREYQPERGKTAYRVHVRLKPEGAPKRYASEENRRAWEDRPRQAAAIAAVGMTPCLSADGLIYDPNLEPSHG